MSLFAQIDIPAELAAVRKFSAEFELDEFTLQTAWNLGSLMRDRAIREGLPIAIDIRRGETPLFVSVLPGAAATNLDWARRKRNLCLLTEKTSWEHALMRANGDDLIDMMGLDPRDYTPHGGCVPVRVHGVGMVATVTVSGLPQDDDHRFVVHSLESLRDGR